MEAGHPASPRRAADRNGLESLPPASKPLPEILRPLEPGEPDPEIEIGYSRNVLEPLTLVHKNHKESLTLTVYVFFRYLYDTHRATGQTEFSFVDLIIAFRKSRMKLTEDSIKNNVKILKEPLENLAAGVSISRENNTVYVRVKKYPGARVENYPEKPLAES